jgi:hypothetical protein
MLPKLTELELGFKTGSAETYICARKHLIEGVSYGREIDYNVQLASKQFLQRPLIWTPHQKSEWIWSLITERPIPPVAIHKTDDTLEVIDGKQRMHTIGEYLRNEFPLFYGKDLYLFSDLPQEYQERIMGGRPVLGYLAYDLTDLHKIQWFRWINYAGTAQDQKHILKLEKLLKQQEGK